MLREVDPPPTQPAEMNQASAFSRQQVLRLLSLTERVLRNWERRQLVPQQTEYRFSDLLLLKTIVRLRKERVSTIQIRRALLALRDRLKHDPELLADVRVFSQGQRVRVQMGKQQMEPVSGQLIFDFRENELSKLLHLPKATRDPEKTAELLRQKMESTRWFEQGLDLEQRGAPIKDAIEAYEKAIALDAHAAGALVNLGTLHFNGHAWAEAEKYYLRALEIDPEYALAYFNLGNLYDEQGDSESATAHYRKAVKLQPGYADAHYNLALLHQNGGEVMEAVKHWRIYLKLDRTSTWSRIAREELSKLQAATVFPGRRLQRL